MGEDPMTPATTPESAVDRAANEPRPREGRWRDVLILALIAVIAYLLGRGSLPGAGSADDVPLAAKDVSENADMIAVTGEFGMGTSVLYLIDTKKRSLVVYEARGGSRSDLRLIAARDVTYDMRLRSYNDSTESSMRVDELERKWRNFSRGNGNNKKVNVPRKPARRPKAEAEPKDDAKKVVAPIGTAKPGKSESK